MSRIKRPREKTAARLPIIGKIKCGVKGERYPKSVDYFIPQGKYEQSFRNAFGDKPQTLPIVFIGDDADGQCEERYEYRDKSGSLYAYGDGDQFHVWNKSKFDVFQVEEHPDIMQRVHEKVGAKGWTITLTLRFLLPTIPVVGLWQLTTKGEASSIPNITGAFDQMIQFNGTVKGVLWDLNVEFAKSQKPDSSSRFPVISIVPNHEPERVSEVKSALVEQSKLIKQLKA